MVRARSEVPALARKRHPGLDTVLEDRNVPNTGGSRGWAMFRSAPTERIA